MSVSMFTLPPFTVISVSISTPVVFNSTSSVPLISTTGMFSVKVPWKKPAIPLLLITKPPTPSVMLISVFVPSVKSKLTSVPATSTSAPSFSKTKLPLRVNVGLMVNPTAAPSASTRRYGPAGNSTVPPS